MTCIKQPFAYAIVWVLCFVLWVVPGIAAECQRDNFDNWLEAFKQEASAQGFSHRTIASALNGVAYDPAVIARDRSQSVFQQSFEQFSDRAVSPSRLRKGTNEPNVFQVTIPAMNLIFLATAARDVLLFTPIRTWEDLGLIAGKAEQAREILLRVQPTAKRINGDAPG